MNALHTLRFQLSLGRDWQSRLIAWYGQGSGGWSHVDIFDRDGWLVGARSDVIKGIPTGVQRRPPHYEAWKRRAILSLPVTGDELASAYAYLKKNMGHQYDTAAIWAFITGNRQHNRGHWICSAFGTGVLRHIHKIGKLMVPDSQVTPNEFAELVCAAGATYHEYPGHAGAV